MGYAALLLNCSSKAAKPESAVVLLIADCCLVGRGDDGADDDNDDELLIFAVVGCNCCAWLLKPVFSCRFFPLALVLVRSTMTMKSQPQWYTIFHYAWVGCNDDTLAVVRRTQY